MGFHGLSGEPLRQERSMPVAVATGEAFDAAGGRPKATGRSGCNGPPGSCWKHAFGMMRRLADATASPAPSLLPCGPFERDETP
jgi:hypothetical protein